MHDTLHVLALETLKEKYDLSQLSNAEIYKAYREIYEELKLAEKDFVKTKPGMKILQ